MPDKLLKGIFMGYVERSGGVWAEEVLIMDWIELSNAQDPSSVHPKTFMWKEVFLEIKF